MIPWWIAIVALIVGILFGFVLLALVTANEEERK